MTKDEAKQERFLTDVGQVANDPKDFKNPCHLILEMVNKRMKELNWLPFDWKLQRKQTHKAIKKGIDWR